MQNRRLLFLLILCVFFITGYLHTNSGYCQTTAPLPAMTPDAQQAIQSDLQKASINLTPEEIQKGKEMLEQRGKGKAAPEKREKAADVKKQNTEEEPSVKAEDKSTEITKKTSLFNRTRQTGKYQDISLDTKLLRSNVTYLRFG